MTSQASPSVEEAALLLQSVAHSVLLSLEPQYDPSDPPQARAETPAQDPSGAPHSPGQHAQSVHQSEGMVENQDPHQLNGGRLPDQDTQMHSKVNSNGNSNGAGSQEATASHQHPSSNRSNDEPVGALRRDPLSTGPGNGQGSSMAERSQLQTQVHLGKEKTTPFGVSS